MLHTLDYLKMLSSLKKLLILQEKYLFLDNLVFLLSINKYFLHSGHFFDMRLWDISYVMVDNVLKTQV